MSTYIFDEDLLKYVDAYYESESSSEQGPFDSEIMTLWRDGDGPLVYATSDPKLD